MATIKNEKYQQYALSEARIVPLEDLKIVMTYFINHAALNLGSKVEKADVDRIIEFVTDEFSYLPIYVIGSAFVRGSLGKLKNDKTTLIPRNVYDWIAEVATDYRNKKEHDARALQLSQEYIPFDLSRYPMGRAIAWKIDHVTVDNWERVPLKIVAEMIGNRDVPTLKDFGI